MNLLDTIATKQEALSFLDKLEALGDNFYHTRKEISRGIGKLFTIEEAEILEKYCKSKEINIKDFAEYKRLVEEYRIQLENTKLLLIYFSFEPSKELVQKIAGWVILNIKRKLLLEVHINQELIAGSALVYDGKYRDYSMKRELDKYWKKRGYQLQYNVKS